jgi:predicted permease
VNGLLVILALLLVGAVLARTGAVPDGAAEVLHRLVILVVIPAVVLLRVPGLALSGAVLLPALLPWIALGVSAAVVLAYARVRALDRATTGALLLLVPLGNTSFLGFPMVEALLGRSALPYAVVYDQFGSFVAVTTYGSFVLARHGAGGAPSLRSVLRRDLAFPPFVAFVLALASRGLAYPAPVVALLEAVAATLLPLVMLAVGMQLRFRLPEELRAPLLLGLAVKMAVAPAVVLLVCRALGADGDAARASILESAMPPMVTAGALASAAGLAPRLAAALVGAGIVISFVTLPLLAAFL